MPHNSAHFILHAARALLLGLAASLIALALQSGPALGEEVGTITKIRADAYGTPPEGNRERKYPRYDVVFGELIETDGGAALLITMNDDTELFLGERASLTIDEFVYDPGGKTARAVYNFTVGSLRFVSGNMDSAAITIQTPNANIGLRGSEAIIFVTPGGDTIVNVLQGTFWVRRLDTSDSERSPVAVSANQNVSVIGTAPPSPIGVGIQMPTYGHAPGATDLDGGALDTDTGHDEPDFSDDLKELTPGSGFDTARPGKVTGDHGDDDHHDDGHDSGH